MYLICHLTGIVFISLICFISVIIIKKYDTYKKITPLYIFIFVKNNEECIEGVLRLLISHLAKNKYTKDEIIVIDMNSQDQTTLIVKKLCRKYNFIHLVESDTYD